MRKGEICEINTTENIFKKPKHPYTKELINLIPRIENINQYLKSLNNYEIIEQDIYNEKTISNLNNRYNIIFLDPPYKDKEIFKILEFVKNNQILYYNGIVIIHCHKKEDDKYLSKYKILEKKYYGISKIIFLSLN